MQFKEIGNLLDGNSFEELIKGTFNGFSSINDMDNIRAGLLNDAFKIGTDGLSAYKAEQIQAKAAAMGLTDSLTSELVVLGKDATLTQKAATGKLTWGKALETAGNNIDEVGRALLNSGKLGEVWQIKLKNALESDNTDTLKQNITGAMNSVDGLSDSIVTLDTSVKPSGGGLVAYFKGITASAKALFTTLATNPITYIVAGMTAGFIALHKYNTEFKNAVKNAQDSQNKYSSSAKELKSLNSQAESYKDTLTSLADTYEIKLTGEDDISDIIDKLQSSNLSLEDKGKVEQIKSENAELQRQIKLKQILVNQQAKQTEQDAIDALKLKRTSDYTQSVDVTDKTGMVTRTEAKQTDIISASKNELNELRRLKNERQELLDDNINDSKQKKDFKSLDAEIKSYTDYISSNIEQLDALRASFEDENGLMREGLSSNAQKYYKDIISIIDGFNNIDLTPTQQQLSSLESFFDGSAGTNFLKDELIEVAKSGEITTDTLADMGLTLGDLGLSGKDGLSALNKYFKDLASSADEANSSVKEFDGSLQSITDASESENQDKNWNTVSDLFDKAKELDKNKKWGTDDFQSMAQFIAPESAQIATKNTDLKASDYKDLWDKYKSNFEKYFDTDNPLQSAINAQDKLLKSGLGSMDSSGIIKWSDSFKSSADAAKAWGISVEAAEVAMHNLESYGAEFDGITFNAEELENYKS